MICPADENKMLHKLYHNSSYALAFLVPMAFLTSPSALAKPFDLAIGIIIPLHAQVGLDNVIKDYVPKAFRSAARGSLLLTTTVAVIGLLKLNLTGPGLSQTFKSLWIPSVKAEED
jgi:succinate dehydrogenase (ubiquinone) membrane anchor subunit